MIRAGAATATLPAGGTPVLLLTAAFLFRGLFLSFALPGGDPLDETFHFAYACFFAETGHVPRAGSPSIPAEFLRVAATLPASTRYAGRRISWKEFSALPEDRRSELRREAYEYRPEQRRLFLDPNYETQQPPLFYLLAAGPLRFLERSRFSERLLVLRLCAAAVSALSVPLVHAFLRRLLDRRSALAATMAYVVFPGVGSFVGRFTNDALALPIAAALLVIFADAGRGHLPRSRAILLAICLAAGCWTKLYFLLLLPVAPLAALRTAFGRRSGASTRALLACAAAFLSFLPWLIHQKSQTEDWLGLIPSRQATTLGIGALERLEALPGLLTPHFAIVFGRTFLWPGTWSAAGAPPALAVLLTLTLLFLFLAPNLVGGPRSRLRQRTWRSGGLAVAIFLAGQILYAATYAAVGRLRGHAPSAGPDGWYLLILFPVLLCAGCAFGHRVGRRLFLIASVVFLAAEWWMTFGVLPGVYGGLTSFNGANAHFAAYGTYLQRPGAVLRLYERVGLAGASWSLLAVIAGLWLLALMCAVFLPDNRRMHAAPV
jgi:hypothetical protein